MWSLRTQQTGNPGDAEADYRNVGLYEVTEGSGQGESDDDDSDAMPTSASTNTVVDSTPSNDSLTLPDTLPVELPGIPSLPQRIGVGSAGGNPTRSTASEPKELIRSGTNNGASSGSGEATDKPVVKFFGTGGTGKRFVYVIDSSSSMREFGAMSAAKAQLMASLAQLTAEQEFQIIFYNTEYRSLTLRDEASRPVKATEVNRTLARQFIESIQPDGGTQHLPAMELALSFKPDAIFFLTDAQQPFLTEKDLSRLKNQNSGKAAIHSIEFGDGPAINVDNFMKKLARQNGGSYAYEDVREFQK
ncbi:MAG: hypothetical protein ACKVT0_18515 [Planctomycetaceae bacterium]